MPRSGPQYFALYGLVVESDESFGDWPVPRTNTTAAPDVRVRWHEVLPPPDEAPLLFSTSIGASETLEVAASRGGTLWRYPDGARFWVDADARNIHCAGPPHYSREDLATYLLGPLLGFALRSRGHTILHASTIRIGDVAIAVTGPAGAGKSTLTAALAASGHDVVAEDVSVLVSIDPPRVAAGTPIVKLWPDSAAQHGDLPLLTPNWEKRYLQATLGSACELARVYVLSTGDAVGTQALSGREAVVALLDNAYLAYALTAEQRATDLERFARLVEHVRVIRLTRTSDYADLDDLCSVVEYPS